MGLKTFYCPICGEEEENCPHTEDEILEFRDKRVRLPQEALDIIRQIVTIDKLQDMPVVSQWSLLVREAKEFLKNNS